MSSSNAVVLIFVLAIPAAAFIFMMLFLIQRRKAKSAEQRVSEIEGRFKHVIDVDAERAEILSQVAEGKKQVEELRRSYADKKIIFDRLVREMAIFDDKLAFAELGVYEPHFDFTDSEQFKTAINNIRDRQKSMISGKSAVICKTQWQVDGSASKGQTMTNRNIRLTLRAFNNECEAAVANVRWNNALAMGQRIAKAQEQIDNLNASNSIFITADFAKLKLEELRLTHEYREKLKEEKEERAEAARAAREEAKLIRDMERAEEEESRYRKLLDKAKAEAAKATGPQIEAYNERIRLLEQDLAGAHANVERAQAMAEKTRSGYVYIISNVGSFGDQVVKIGLTRRLDPTDRVRELGDASVPFSFDTHAIIYSDDAPTLERMLHTEFGSQRVNTENSRKEFFKASIDAVENAVSRLAPGAPFFKDIEAQEYRETLARRNSALSALELTKNEMLPDTI